MTAILGISAFYHDSAAAILVDGEIIAAAQEERFSRIKHDPSFPHQSIEYCLSAAGLKIENLDHVGFYEKPFSKFDRILETHLSFAPRGLRMFLKSMPVWINQKLRMTREIQNGLERRYRKRMIYADHHLSHAASAFFPSPFEEAAIVTLDGVGEWASTTIGRGRDNQIRLLKELHFPHSLGLLYATFTAFCGFRVNAGEGKLMGLAPYGEPLYAELIKEKLVDLKPDGSFHLNMEYFDYCVGDSMFSKKFADLFAGAPRQPDAEITERELNIAASIQHVVEEMLLAICQQARELVDVDQLCLAGGVALNCVANGKLICEGPFQDVWVQPASGDAGGAVGVAWLIWYQLLNQARTPMSNECIDAMQGAALGPAFDTETIVAQLRPLGVPYRVFDTESQLDEYVCQAISKGKIVGWFQGRMEFGPRALGNRSILGDARLSTMHLDLNRTVKFREEFRPFAPAVLERGYGDYFENQPADWNRSIPEHYMLTATSVKPERRIPTDDSVPEKGLAQLAVCRSQIPAVTHVDYSARVQVVSEATNRRFFQLLDTFDKMAGSPLMVNTSFNVRGEPMVCTPIDALRCFANTDLDVLVLERVVIVKSPNDPLPAIPDPPSQPTQPEKLVVSRTRWWIGSQLVGFQLAMIVAYFVFHLTLGFATLLAAVSWVVAAILFFRPRWALPIRYAWQKLISIINHGVVWVALILIYGLMLTPVGLLMRLAGRDPMQRRRFQKSTSYWKNRDLEVDNKRFFRQY